MTVKELKDRLAKLSEMHDNLEIKLDFGGIIDNIHELVLGVYFNGLEAVHIRNYESDD